MKTFSALLLCTALATGCSKKTDVAPAASAAAEAAANPAGSTENERGGVADLTSVYRYSATDINGVKVNLGDYRGRKILIVNTASQCGYTPQYTDLQTLYSRYSSRVVVLGFPCNDFGGQEPGSNGQISGFCTGTYHVTFPLFSKVDVIGANAIPLYKFLGDQTQNGVLNNKPDWNFCKYLIDEQGHVMRYYPSAVAPLSPALLTDVLSTPNSQLAPTRK